MQGDGVTVKPLGGGFHEFRWTEKSIGPDGKVTRTWRRKKFRCDHAKAQEIKAELMYQTGRRESGATKTFAELCAPYLETCSHQSDFAGKSQIVEFLHARFGNSPLSSLDFREFQKLQTELRSTVAQKKTTMLSAARINRYMAVLKNMIRTAYDWDWCGDDVFKASLKLKNLREDNAIIRYLSADEEVRLMAAIDKSRTRNLRELVVLAINTGMRFGEMNDLTWYRVDLLNRTVWLPGRATKNKKGRHVPLNDNALAALNAIPERIDGGRVFTNARMNEDPFKIALKRARIKNFRFHDLRHTFASRLVMAGIDLYRVSELLGHSNIIMTQRYAHLAPSAGREAVDVLVSRGTNLAVNDAAR